MSVLATVYFKMTTMAAPRIRPMKFVAAKSEKIIRLRQSNLGHPKSVAVNSIKMRLWELMLVSWEQRQAKDGQVLCPWNMNWDRSIEVDS